MSRGARPARCALVVGAMVLLAAVPATGKGSDGGAPAASLRFEPAVVDYGAVAQGRTYTRSVRYTNAGDVAIRNLRTKPDCGCYAVALTETGLAPGASGTLTVRFRTHGMIGRVKKRLGVLYDDGTPRALRLPLVMEVVGGVLVERLHFGEVLHGTKPEGTAVVKWARGKGRPFEITDVRVPGAKLATHVEALPDTPQAKYLGWKIHFRFTEPPPRGVFSERAVVTTTHPDQKRVYVPLTAHVVGKVWLQTSRVYLGLVPQGTSRTATVDLRAFDETVRLGSVRAEARGTTLDVAIEDAFGPRGPVKRLRVTAPPTAPPGPLDDVIEVHTEVPGEERIEVEVRGRVFAPTDDSQPSER